jgi:hypothetical protein
MAFPQPTSANISLTSTEFSKIALGTRARDASGNEYVYCSFAAVHYPGETLQISSAFAAADMTTTTVGVPIGVNSCKTVASSAGWVQVYGVCSWILTSSNSAFDLVGPVQSASTTDGMSLPLPLSAGTNVMINGMYLSTSGTTADANHTAWHVIATANSDFQGSTFIKVATGFLNFPFISGEYAGITS